MYEKCYRCIEWTVWQQILPQIDWHQNILVKHQTQNEYRRHSATVIKDEKVDNGGMVAIIKFRWFSVPVF